MAFDEVQFPADILWGATGGPAFSTGVLTSVSGFEFRNRQWQHSLARYDVSHATRTQAEMDILVAFYRARNGSVRGFRFKDWMDYKLQMDPQVATQSIEALGVGDTGVASQTLGQLQKTYGDAESTYIRAITKPVAGTVQLDTTTNGDATERFTEDSGSVLSPNEDGDFFLGTNGTIIWTDQGDDGNTIAASITGVTTVLVFTPSAVAQEGMSVYITGETGTAGAVINNKRWKVISNPTSSRIEINADTSGLAFNDDGTVYTFPHSSETFRVRDFEFDVPVRFQDDKLAVSIDSYQNYSSDKIVLIEVRDPSISIAQTEPTNTFHHVRLDPKITFGATGAPRFKNNVFTTTGGHTTRVSPWEEDRPEYDVSEGLKDFEDFGNILDFFYARYGKAYGFRFRDWQDYTIEADIVPDTLNEGILTSNPGGGVMRVIRSDAGAASWSSAGYWPGMYLTIDSGADAGTYLISNFFNDDPAQVSIDVFNSGTISTSFGTNTITGQDVSTDVQPDGSTNLFQLAKSYRSGAQATLRHLTCPIEPNEEIVPAKYGSQQSASDLVITLDGVDIDHDANDRWFDVNGREVVGTDNVQTGISHGTFNFALTPRDGGGATQDTLTITNITRATTAVVTVSHSMVQGVSSGHVEGTQTGETLYISGVSGMTQVNDKRYKITRLSTTTFELDGVDSSGFTAYSADGTCTKTPQSEEILTVTGEFDIPVRFGADEMGFTHENYGFYTWGGIPLEGIRLK